MSGAEQPAGLIGVLLDAGAEYGARDDAALDLGESDEPEAAAALLAVAALDTDPCLNAYHPRGNPGEPRDR